MRNSKLRASVVVPTFHRHDLLVRCLEALVNQSFATNEYEVIIADDAASEATETLVHDFAKESRCSIYYIAVQGAHGPAAARNAGWRKARGSVVAFTDDDCDPDCNWLRAGVEHLENHLSDAAVWGRLEMPIPVVPTDYERDASGLASAVFVTANCFVRWKVLNELGGFDERFRFAWREDSDLCFSMLERGWRVMHVPDALVVHPIRPATWGVSLKQQRKSGFDVLLMRKHPELYREHIPPFPVDYVVIVASVFVALAAVAGGNWWLACIAIVLWCALTTEFVLRRLRGTSHSLSHVLEMLVTSVIIPWLAVAFRVHGLWRFRDVGQVPNDGSRSESDNIGETRLELSRVESQRSTSS